jgi:glycosyltransferase involved in cell wall biosynthesis
MGVFYYIILSMKNNIEISLIIPVVNEAENIIELSKLITTAFKELPSYEVIWVDDGSKDNTVEVLENVNKIDKNQKFISLMRNSGQSTALMAGVDYSQGKYIATLDGDMQNFPSDLVKMYEMLKEKDLDMVVGWRKNRWKEKKDSIVRRLPSIVANMIIQKAFRADHLHDAGCPVKITRADLFKEIRLYGELHRFIAYIAHDYGARIAEVEVQHAPRMFGKSNYGLSRTFKVIVDIFNLKLLHMRKTTPAQLMAPLVIISGFLSVLTFISAILLKFFRGEDLTGNPLLTISIFTFLMAIQFMIFGFLGELIIRSYYENGDKKTYLIRKMS